MRLLLDAGARADVAVSLLARAAAGLVHREAGSQQRPILQSSTQLELTGVASLLPPGLLVPQDADGALPLHDAAAGGYVRSLPVLLAWCWWLSRRLALACNCLPGECEQPARPPASFLPPLPQL